VRRGEIWWASLGTPTGSSPAYRRPVVVVQADEFTESRIATVVCAAVTSNTALAAAPGNVLIQGRSTGLRTASVVNVSQVLTLNKGVLTERIGRIPPETVSQIDAGLRLVLSL